MTPLEVLKDVDAYLREERRTIAMVPEHRDRCREMLKKVTETLSKKASTLEGCRCSECGCEVEHHCIACGHVW